MPEIFEKWGFGIAPPKPEIHARRDESAHVVLDLIASAHRAARAGANGDRVKTEQLEWIKRYGPDCGLPLRGRPSSDLISNVSCASAA